MDTKKAVLKGVLTMVVVALAGFLLFNVLFQCKQVVICNRLTGKFDNCCFHNKTYKTGFFDNCIINFRNINHSFKLFVKPFIW